MKLEKQQTGLASEFYAAGELARLGYNVTLTFGNTKSIDLIVERFPDTFKVQVKGIQDNKSICWNLDKTKVRDDIYYILVNLHVNSIEAKPEFFILKGIEIETLFRDTPKEGRRRTYLDYNRIKRLNIYQNRWDVFGSATELSST